MTSLNETIKDIQNKIDSGRKGDYINISGSTNEIINANVFNKNDYEDFIKNQKDSWVEGGSMVSLDDVDATDIVISYYGLGGNGEENSFIVGTTGLIESADKALNYLAIKVIENEEG